MRALAAIAVAFIALIVVFLAYRAEPDRILEANEAREMKKGQEAKISSPSVVLSINAAKASPIPVASMDAMSPMAREYQKAKNLKPLYDRLKAGGAATPEGKYFLYKITARCASRTDQPSATPSKSLADRRKDMEAQIPMTNPDREKRLAAFDQLNASERCLGLEDTKTTKAELDQMLKDAAAAGDPKARAAVTASEIGASGGPVAGTPGPNGPGGPSITDAQYQALRDAIASRDPEAIAIAGMTLSNTYRDAVMEIGPNHDELQGRASMEAWNLVACEFGAECGPSSPSLQQACAYGGQCAATTVPDQVYFYGVTPYEAQLIDQYRQLFHNAAANNDWSGLELARRTNNANSRYYFGATSH